MSIRIPVALAALLAVAACDPREPVEITEREAVGMLQTIIRVTEDVVVFEPGDVDMAPCPEGDEHTGLIDGTFQGGLCGFDVIVEWDELGPES